MSVTVVREQLARRRRTLVTSDIHGHGARLRALLAGSEFTPDDLLVIAGDTVEKGVDSLGTLRYVMELASRGNAIVLAGNVDRARARMIIDGAPPDKIFGYLEYMRGWLGTSLIDEMAREDGRFIASPGEVEPELARIRVRFARELEFLLTRPHILETESFVFVHAGLPDAFGFPNADFGGLEALDERDVLTGDAFLTRAPRFSKHVVVGHWPVTLYSDKIACCEPIFDRERRIIALDGGCGVKADGQLNLVVLPDAANGTDGAFSLRRDDFPVVTALDAQSPSPDSINVRWGDNEIKILGADENFTLAEHVRTGRRLNIQNNLIRDGRLYGDFTDYDLPVAPGDRLSIISETPRGYYAKLRGTIGWYRGGIRKI